MHSVLSEVCRVTLSFVKLPTWDSYQLPASRKAKDAAMPVTMTSGGVHEDGFDLDHIFHLYEYPRSAYVRLRSVSE